MPRSRRIQTLAAVVLAALASAAASAQSLRFFGSGVNDIDRVKIAIDDPANNNPGPPADVGGTDFTIEFWLRAQVGSNPAPALNCAATNSWINGNIVFDRDRFDQNRAFGISLGDGRVAFGTLTSSALTICAASDLRDGAWHHVAVQRRRSTGALSIYVDGSLEASGDTPDNEDLSYPDNGVPLPRCGVGANQPCTNSDPFIVLGAEKHDAGSQYPSFDGWLDELRISTVIRYSSNFTPPQSPFTLDAATAALYHFDETSGLNVIDENGNQSPGVMRVGGSSNGPQHSTDTPFGATPAAGTVQLGAAAYTVAENLPSVMLTAVRVGGSAGAVSVDWSTSPGTASAGSDYTHTMGTSTWADGNAAAKNIVVPLLDDAVFEGSETFSVALSNVIGGAALGARSTATVTLTDNEAPAAPGVLELTSATFSAAEGAGTATITARRISGADGNVGVSYSTANGTAIAGADYQAASGTLEWANGDSAAKSFALAIVNDTLVEGSETLTVSLGQPTGGATLGTPVAAQLSIVDDDSATGSGGGGGSGASGAGSLLALAVAAWLRAKKRRIL